MNHRRRAHPSPAIAWLLAGDPAIRWQAMRDLTDAPEPIVTSERARVASEGLGAKLMGRHFQVVDAAPDPHLGEAVDLLRAKRRQDGRWVLENRYPGKTWFALERIRAASRWSTLRALRVLRWWEG